MAHRATITQVAERAGVSIASASRALNGLTASPFTVERVQAAARELGYVADATARALKMGRTLQLAFAVDDIGNPVYVQMMKAIQGVVSASGYRLMILSTGDAAQTVDLLRSLSNGYVDGMILSPLRVSEALVAELRAVPVPVVVIGRLPDDAPVDTVMTDSGHGVGLAVEHLLATGRTRIGFVNGPLDTTPGAARRRGFDDAIARSGAHADVVAAAEFTVGAGTAAAAALLDRPGDRPDAVVAANDLLAIGVLHAAHDLGLAVPDDLAVVGMDDTELAAVFRPSLSSVSLGSSERGTRAAELLLDRLADPVRRATTVVVPPALVVRDSSGPGRGAR